MQLNLSFITDPLILPKRYELLERKASEKGAEITKIVKKIDTANEQIQNLLGKIHVGGVGQFQLFFGESGSGKTTFLRTLSNFFKNIRVHSFDANNSFQDIINQIVNDAHFTEKRIYIIDDRDNPKVAKEELQVFFESLRILFRKAEGAVLIVWPITDSVSCKLISDVAWEVGKESLSPTEGPIYNFIGLPKRDYFEVADDTVRSLNNGETIESYGITKAAAASLLSNCATIGSFYSQIEKLAYEMNESKWKILEEKVKPKIWIVLTGDSTTELDRTVRSLTQGIEGKVDIDRVCAFLDDPENTSAYLNDWRKRRAEAGFLFRFLDVRLFHLSPNFVLSAIRVFGSDTAKEALKKKTEQRSICVDLVRRASLYIALTDQTDSSKRSERSTKSDTQNEYIRVQQKAKSQDKELNKAISKAIESVLTEDGFKDFAIKCEKQSLTGTSLKPDILVELNPKEVVCIEVTWRSTGTKIEGETETKQNTLSPGHIQKYILEKIMEYVKDLDI
ncbi:MAG: hypothetical protein JNK73_15225 [Bacteroidia bacterium]|nr:hypothetical protein [Bacteroidia bacterium]